MSVSEAQRKLWAEELQLEWSRSKEDYHGWLVAKFREILEAGYSSHGIIYWLEQVPRDYWESVKSYRGVIGYNIWNWNRRDHRTAKYCKDDTCFLYTAPGMYIIGAEFIIFWFPIKVVEFILTAGCSSVANQSLKTTALHFSVASGKIALTKHLIEEHIADVNALDSWGWNSLCYALKLGSLEMAKLLLGYGASCNFSQAKMFCPFFQAIIRSNLELFDLVLSLRINPTDHCTGADDLLINEKTCLQVAASQGQRYVMLHLFKHGANPRTLSLDGRDLFYKYVINSRIMLKYDEYVNFLKWFLALKMYSIEVKVPQEDYYRCMDLWTFADEEIFRLLIQNHGFDFGEFTQDTKVSMVSGNVMRNERSFKDFTLTLKEFRQDYNFYTNLSTNKLFCSAVREKNLYALKFFLKRGYNINEKSKTGSSPLHYAIGKMCLRSISFLLLHGAEVDDKTSLLADDISRSHPDQEDQEDREEIIRLLVKYITLSEFSKEPLNNEHFRCRQLTQDIRDFHESCQRELSLMKNHFIHDSVSFFDLLSNGKRFSRDLYVIKALANEDTRKRFPLYFDILNERFSLVRKRPELEMKAVSSLEKIMRLPANAFPIVFDNIFVNLGCKDLRILALV